MNDNTARSGQQDDAPSRGRAPGKGDEDDERLGTTPDKLRLVTSSSSSNAREERLRFFADEDELVARMLDELEIAEVEAIRAIQQFGPRRVEASLLKTISSPGVRVPAAWFYSTLHRCLEWTAQEVELYAQRHGSGASRGIEAEWGRWAEYLIRGDYPPDFRSWLEPNRDRYEDALRDVQQRRVIGGDDGER